jgi:hypothetical protein
MQRDAHSKKEGVTGSDTHIYYLLTELLWEQYCRLFGQHPKVRKQIADTNPDLPGWVTCSTKPDPARPISRPNSVLPGIT